MELKKKIKLYKILIFEVKTRDQSVINHPNRGSQMDIK